MAKYELLWEKGNTKRYYVNGTGIEIQIGKYRGLDSFDKEMKQKPTWHGKWYVNILNKGTKLFNTQKQARVYLMKLIDKTYKTKQLRKTKATTLSGIHNEMMNKKKRK